MWTLKRLHVRGFRGFAGPQDFVLDNPLTLLFGPNRGGKSSTLNAVEWCLFGAACAGQQTQIRERIGWVLAHVGAEEVQVELELHGPGGTWVVRRGLTRPGRKRPQETLDLTLPDGQSLTGEPAERRLGLGLHASLRDFATIVYQHQETIRAILTQEPRERNDAIDRLLGLSEYRNLLGALQKANPRGRHKALEQKVSAFRQAVAAALAGRDRDLEELRREAGEAGIARAELTAPGALAAARAVRQALADFAAEAGLGLGPLEAPDDVSDLAHFHKAVKSAIQRFRGEVPGLQEQQELFERQAAVVASITDLEKARHDYAAVHKATRALDQEHGGAEAVAAQIEQAARAVAEAKERLRTANARAALVAEAITFLEGPAGPAPDQCPLCGGRAPDLLEGLRRQWRQRLQAEADGSQAQLRTWQDPEQRLRQVADEYRHWRERLEAVLQERARCRDGAGVLLGRPIGPQEDALALLRAEVERVRGRLDRLGRAVQARHCRLSEIEQDLDRVRLLRDVLQLEERRRAVARIEDSPEYRGLEAAREHVAELVSDLEALKEAVGRAANEDARDKLARAETTIDQYFRRLAGHPAVRAVRLGVRADARSGRNVYTVTDQDGQDLTPVLSQGDLNALALAIFLGLAASADEEGGFGFVLLDDPSQSLDGEHKRHLVRVLDEVARRKQLVLATMDREFRDCLAEGLTCARAEYLFGSWDPATGPTISRV
jgi:DNA repair exonuclease SbcCD ATPase subunit